MAANIGNCLGVEITLDANLQGNAVIINVVQQITIFDQSGAMADAMRSTIVQGLVDAFRAIGFSGVDGDIEVILQSKVKGFFMIFGGMIITISSPSNKGALKVKERCYVMARKTFIHAFPTIEKFDFSYDCAT